MTSSKTRQRKTSRLLVGRRIRSGYLHAALDPIKLPKLIKLCVSIVSKLKPDTIVVRGLSGTLVGLPLALRLKVHFAFVRKGNDTSHSLSGIEGPRELGRFVIIDDFVSSGGTLGAIMKAVEDHDDEVGSNRLVAPLPRSTVVGVVLYNETFDKDQLRRKIDNELGTSVPVSIIDIDAVGVEEAIKSLP